LAVGQTLSFAGTVDLYQSHLTIIAPVFGPHNTGKIIPVYPETKGLTSSWFRKTIPSHLSKLISQVSDPLPSTILRRFNLFPLASALHQIHSPSNQKNLNFARLRLAVDEILSLQAQSYLQKKHWQTLQPKNIFALNPQIETAIDNFVRSLPFDLTPSQKSVWKEIKTDLLSPSQPANRLIQGDVGSGKTVLAMLACLLASQNHCLSLVLVPTSILAQQHYQNFKKFFKKEKIPIRLLTSSSGLPARLSPRSIIIATHAAIYKNTDFKEKISLLVVDEQHKFGVRQRSFLHHLSRLPHCLTMTATPIPRTVSLALLRHLDLSILQQPPSDRLPIKTFLVPKSKIPDCYRWLQSHLHQTHQQAFIVCPFIESSETLTSVKSAKQEFDLLSKQIFPDLRLALVHGRLKPDIRHQIITDFLDKKINILVTTPIIEVGIDIKNATTIIIQSADRFGLAQLHQLRGRVGRGSLQSYCYLFTDSVDSKAVNRLQFMENHHNGLQLAEYDLKTRGPGEIFSTLQHGFPSLKLASLSNLKLTELSQKILTAILVSHPNLDLKTLIQSANLSSNPVTN